MEAQGAHRRAKDMARRLVRLERGRPPWGMSPWTYMVPRRLLPWVTKTFLITAEERRLRPLVAGATEATTFFLSAKWLPYMKPVVEGVLQVEPTLGRRGARKLILAVAREMRSDVEAWVRVLFRRKDPRAGEAEIERSARQFLDASHFTNLYSFWVRIGGDGR